MQIRYHRGFKKQHKKLTKKQQGKFKEQIHIFCINPFDPTLGNHVINHPYENCRSINVGGDIRAIYTVMDNDTVVFIAIGSHSQLYR